jgi:hypothetical protein
MNFGALKRLLIIVFFAYVSYLFVYSADASVKKNFGDFKYPWHSSDCSEIGFINKQKEFNIVYNIESDCKVPTGSIEKFNNLIKQAGEAWCKPLNLKFKVLDNYTNDYTLRFEILSRKTFSKIKLNDPANKNESFDRKSVIGLVNRDDFLYVGSGVSEKVDISVYKINKATIYIVWDNDKDSKYKTSHYDYNNWLKLFTHEFGHAIGYRGHNNQSDSKPIMFNDGSELMDWDIKNPNKEDIEHLKNIYSSELYLEYR